jgi:hypothetical protein
MKLGILNESRTILYDVITIIGKSVGTVKPVNTVTVEFAMLTLTLTGLLD